MNDTHDTDKPPQFDLTRLYDSREAWTRERDALAAAIETFDTERPLSELLPAFERLSEREHRLRAYAILRADTATDTDKRAADRTRANTIHTELLDVRATVERRVRNRDGEIPAQFTHYAADVRRRGRYALDPAGESVVSALDDVLSMPTRVHRATTQDDFEPPTVEIDGEAVTLTNPERARLRRSDDRETRRRVYDAICDAYRDRRATLAATIDAMARRNVRLADERGYESALAAALDDGGGFVACRPADSLSVDSYETLLEGVRSRLDPTHRVDRVIKHTLGVADLREYDRLSSAEAQTWTFTEAKETLLASVAPLGDEYRETMATMFEQQRIDAADYEGKRRRGAYSMSTPDGAFLLTRWDGSLSRLFLLAHELGHAVHCELAADRSHVAAGIPEPISELPSKMHEILLADHLLDTTTGQTHRAVVAQTVRSVGSNLYYSTRWALFAQAIHRHVANGNRVNAAFLDEQYARLYREFNPETVVDDRVRAGWTVGLYEPPLYHHYPYVLGTVGALVIVDSLGDDVSAGDYVDFLATGTARPAVESLTTFEIDATSDAAVGDAVERFDAYVGVLDSAY